MALSIETDVVGLEVSKDDVLFVHGLDAAYDLTNVPLCPVLSESALQLQVLGQVSSFTELHHHVQVLLRLETVVELHNKRGSGNRHLLHDHLFGIGILPQLLLLDLLLFEYFHGH